MRKRLVILLGIAGVLLLPRFAWTGEIEVLYGGRWKVLKTELINNQEYVPLFQVAKISGGRVLRDGLRVKRVTFRLVEGEAKGAMQ